MTNQPLPPGQRFEPSFHRFGLSVFANRFPARTEEVSFLVAGDVESPLQVREAFAALPRVDQVSDFHCVTTWSCQNLRWSGVRFSDFYEQIVLPLAKPEPGATHVIFRGQDGYRNCLLLEDLLAPDVLLADRLDGEMLGIDHGAPLRLVAPAHYGYKSVKHIQAIEFCRDRRNYSFPFPYPGFMDHPRARVALEERASGWPNWLIRPIYTMLVGPARRKSARTLAKHLRRKV